MICKRGRSVELTEKVRRTAKIWGDRMIYSTRFVGDLLKRLEEFRNGAAVAQEVQVVEEDTIPEENRFSPLTEQEQDKDASGSPSITAAEAPSQPEVFEIDSDASMTSQDALPESSFQTKSSLSFTNLRVDKDAFEKSSKKPFGLKRRLSDQGSRKKKKLSKLTSSSSSSPTTKPKASISSSGFVELLSQLSHADSTYKLMKASYNSNIASSVHNLKCEEDVDAVGDELLTLHKEVVGLLSLLEKKRGEVHDLANTKWNGEEDMERYLKWMVGLVHVDEDEFTMCCDLEQSLELIQEVHATAKTTRDKARRKQAQEEALAAEEKKRREEEEERKRALEIIRQETGKKREGMVWNKTAREWQELPDATEESWRD